MYASVQQLDYTEQNINCAGFPYVPVLSFLCRPMYSELGSRSQVLTLLMFHARSLVRNVVW